MEEREGVEERRGVNKMEESEVRQAMQVREEEGEQWMQEFRRTTPT